MLQCSALQAAETSRLSDFVNNGAGNGRAAREMQPHVNKQSHPEKFFS